MNITFFDTETTGIPPNGANWETDYKSFPYIVQLSWKRSGMDYINDFIIDNDIEIPKEATEVHGISTEMAKTMGRSPEDILPFFIYDCLASEKIAAHNIYFDTSIIKANILRYFGKGSLHEKALMALDKDKRIDTMMSTISFCNIPFSNGRGKKWPKLEELYFKLFGETFNAHNAKDDVLATERCYVELVKRKIL